jgi:hypothetical protein
MAGNKVRLTATFTDANGALLDPGTVALKYQVDNGAITTVTWAGAQVIRDSLGVFHYDIDTSGLVGGLEYEWVTTGAGQAAASGVFRIIAQPV